MSITWLISRLAILAFLWWVLAKGNLDSWQVGIPAILAAIYIDYRLFRHPANRWSLGGVIVFALFFLKLSVTSGVDVVRRIYHPRLPLNPAMVDYPLKLTFPAARNLFVCTVSLLPGTLSAELGRQRLVVHVLDIDRPFNQELKLIEDRVAAVFRHPEPLDDHMTETD
ncbi:MAG: Na+/H+ antiporter subunit E [Desulfobacterales bacterium]|jgi:multicomponent Na+:H+ antiporter subunit E